MNNTISGNEPNQENQTSEQSKDTAGSPLNSLSPIDNADPDGHYSEMLLWALNNREEKDIKNIALTGPYGSGKSSVLKTFEKKHQSDDLVFLNITLATFKEEDGVSPSKIKSGKHRTSAEQNEDDENIEEVEDKAVSAIEKQANLRLVELSILQQFFYHERDEDIPDTRFKKTRSFSDESADFLSWNIFFFIISLIYLLYSTAIWNTFNIDIPKHINAILNLFALATVLWMGYLFIRQSIRPLRSIQLKKFNFQQAEFAIDENISKSILNEHLDEILYFFEVTKYTVVVFEDLDRFKQTEIFTKLRELNHLINYSKKMKGRKVTFIYAVRDEMFQDKDRTKFFDFIIPVIPVINSTNSNEILRNIVKDNNYQIKEDLLDNIALCVDDMRLLFNIMNEYYLYHKKLDKKLDQNKLLGILIYKNIYPNDFVDLSNNKGILFNAIHKKDDFITKKTSELIKQIEEKEAEIKRLGDISIINADELRKLYVLGFLQQYPEATGFRLTNTDYRIEQLCEEAIFDKLVEEQKRKYSSKNQYNQILYTDAPITFSKIENIVSPGVTYEKRLSEIIDLTEGKNDILRKEVKTIQDQINSVKHTPIHTLLKDDLVEIKMDNEAQQLLASLLLRGDYINESYQDYLSIFYEGSLTRTDRDFILSVKGHKKTDYDFPLNSIDKIIKKIPDFEFENNYVLNYSLVDFLFSEEKSKQHREKIIKLLTNESEIAINFIDGYLDNTGNEGIFIKALAKEWSGIWRYIVDRASFTNERKNHYLNLIIEHVEVTNLQKIAKHSKLVKYLEQKANFLSCIKNEEKLKKIIETFKLKFEEPDLYNAPVSLIDFVFENDHYQINTNTLEAWMKYKGVYIEQEYVEQNYSAIKRNKKKLGELVKYVDDNLTDYLKNVWLKLEGDKQEDPEYFWYVIDKEGLPDELKRSVLDRNQPKFENFDEFLFTTSMQLLLETNKIEPTWANLLRYYTEESNILGEYLVSFINDVDNAKALSMHRFEYNKEDEEEKKSADEFSKQLILCPDINDSIYGQLITKLPWIYGNLDFSSLSEEKVKMVISILMVTKANYNRLRENFTPLHIGLLEKGVKTVIEKLDDFDMDAEDVSRILVSPKFKVEEKNIILHKLSDNAIIANKDLLNKVGVIASVNSAMIISKEVITVILKSDLDILNKVALYNKQSVLFSGSEFFDLMEYFGKGFNEIKQNGKQTVIPETEQNWELAIAIYKQGYTFEPKKDKRGIRIRNKKK